MGMGTDVRDRRDRGGRDGNASEFYIIISASGFSRSGFEVYQCALF